MGNLNFDASAFEEQSNSFELIEPGKYTAVIENSEMCNVKDTTKFTFRGQPNTRGEYLKLTWRITEGKYTGRLVWENINLVNKNPTAVDIAEKVLARVCKAAGMNHHVSDSSELHGRPMIITVKINKGTNGYEAETM